MRVEPSTAETMREALARVEVVARAFGWTEDDKAAARALAQRRPGALLSQLRVWSAMKPGPDPAIPVTFAVPGWGAMDCPVCGRPAGTCDCHGGATPA